MPPRPGSRSWLLLGTAFIESAVGVVLLIAPAPVAQLLLGAQLPPGAPALVARIAGAALLALGLSCWLERRPATAAVSGLVAGLLVYNVAVFALLIYAALVEGLRGIGTWPACALHLAMALWCARVMRAPTGARS